MTAVTPDLAAATAGGSGGRAAGSLLRRLVGRLAAGVGVLWGAATLTFIAMNATGGDMAIAILGGPEALPTAAALAQVRKDYGLDQPLALQYLHYLGKLARGDLGESYRLHIPVVTAITQQVGPTLVLAFWAGALAIVLSIVIATATARRAPFVRSATNGAELVTSSMPSFVIGILLLLAFSFKLHLFPIGGDHGWRSLVLPVVTLALPVCATLSQVLRQSLEDVLEQPFILMARARGMSDAAVRLGHALRHALVPLITLSGFIFASLLGGAVVTETLFARPGLGRLMVDATTNSDVPVVVGVTLFVALLYVVINLIVDLLNAVVDPRTVSR
jgi:peptide/nickel transport system permease protein